MTRPSEPGPPDALGTGGRPGPATAARHGGQHRHVVVSRIDLSLPEGRFARRPRVRDTAVRAGPRPRGRRRPSRARRPSAACGRAGATGSPGGRRWRRGGRSPGPRSARGATGRSRGSCGRGGGTGRTRRRSGPRRPRSSFAADLASPGRGRAADRVGAAEPGHGVLRERSSGSGVTTKPFREIVRLPRVPQNSRPRRRRRAPAGLAVRPRGGPAGVFEEGVLRVGRLAVVLQARTGRRRW